MASLSLDDRTGRIEVTLFNEAYEQYRDVVAADKVLVVEGGLVFDEFRGAYSLRADRVVELERARAAHATAPAAAHRAHDPELGWPYGPVVRGEPRQGAAAVSWRRLRRRPRPSAGRCRAGRSCWPGGWSRGTSCCASSSACSVRATSASASTVGAARPATRPVPPEGCCRAAPAIRYTGKHGSELSRLRAADRRAGGEDSRAAAGRRRQRDQHSGRDHAARGQEPGPHRIDLRQPEPLADLAGGAPPAPALPARLHPPAVHRLRGAARRPRASPTITRSSAAWRGCRDARSWSSATRRAATRRRRSTATSACRAPRATARRCG